MAKVGKVFTIEQDLAFKLEKEANASAIVNQALQEYYDRDDLNKLPRDVLLKLLDMAEQKEKLERDMEELKRGVLNEQRKN